jgi:hypothetical protein
MYSQCISTERRGKTTRHFEIAGLPLKNNLIKRGID